MQESKRMRVYIARQPIMDRQRELYGYELLYRSSEKNAYDQDIDGSAATRALISDAMITFGIHNLVGGKHAFINFTQALLVSGYPMLLPPEHFVVEVLEDAEMNDILLSRLKELKSKGYTLAMDDYVGDVEQDELIACMDIIKVDFRLTDPAQQKRIAQTYADKILLAEKVETEEEFLRARKDGYDLFQGYYFSQPVVYSEHQRSIATATYARLWQEITREDVSFERLAEIIRSDVTLSYRFIQRVNTMEYYLGHRVGMLKHALVRMGISELRRWILLILLRDTTGAQSDEFVRTALVRGVFAEQLAPMLGDEKYSEQAYAAALFSVLDEEEWQKLNQEDPLFSEVHEGGRYREQMATLLRFVEEYEQGNWDKVSLYAEEHGLDRGTVTTCYLESLYHADLLFGTASLGLRWPDSE